MVQCRSGVGVKEVERNDDLCQRAGELFVAVIVGAIMNVLWPTIENSECCVQSQVFVTQAPTAH